MKYIVGNWKMNGLTAEAQALAGELKSNIRENAARKVVVCPPAPVLPMVQGALKGAPIFLGGQDCHYAEKGAYTGDISAAMLADAGCRYVIVGHSERRVGHGENDALVSRKAEAAGKAGLTPIICIGETLAEREAGKTLEILMRQAFQSVPKSLNEEIIIAYEPVWAIGTGKTATEGEIEETQGAVRQAFLRERGLEQSRLSVLYGGSVKAGNAGAILALPSVGGVLVGGASLIAEEFCAIAAAVN